MDNYGWFLVGLLFFSVKQFVRSSLKKYQNLLYSLFLL